MPKAYQTKSLGYSLSFQGPGTVEEFDQKAGKVGACLEGGVDDELYRGTLPDWQEKFGKEVLVPLFGERQVNQKATDAARARAKTDEAKAKVKDVLESWTTYHDRVTAGLDEEAKKELAAKAQSIADGIEIDPSPSKRRGALRKDLREKAESILTLPLDQLETKITGYLEEMPGYELERVEDDDNKPTVESLGRLLGAIMQKRMQEL